MLNNCDITYYHKGLDENKLPTWTRYTFKDVWKFGGKGSTIYKGYENSNMVEIRIPMEKVNDISIFAIEDIVAIGIQPNITKQSDLQGTEFYNITKVNVNSFGVNPHIHLGGQ